HRRARHPHADSGAQPGCRLRDRRRAPPFPGRQDCWLRDHPRHRARDERPAVHGDFDRRKPPARGRSRYEESQGYAELLKLPGYDVTAVAGKIGRSESYVRARLKLLDLAPDVVEEFLNGGITFAHARLIAPLGKEKQAEALEQCFARFGRDLTKREL